MAADNNMCIKLHVDDGCGNEGFGIPLKQLLPNERHGSSYNTLRYFALAALFRYENGVVPEYALKNFGTRFSFKHQGKTIVIPDDARFSDLLEKYCSGYLMDDTNDDVVLEVYCQFSDQYWQKGKQRQRGADAADNMVKTMKNWVNKASNAFKKMQNKMEQNKVGADFVEIDDQGQEKKKSVYGNPIEQWTTNFVRVVLNEGAKQKTKKIVNSQEVVMEKVEHAFDIFAFTLLKVCKEASGLLEDFVVRHEDAIHDVFMIAVGQEPRSVLDARLACSLSAPAVEEEPTVEETANISYDQDDKNAPEEWKIFFEKEENNNGVVLERPNTDDVISISSEEQSSSSDESSIVHVDAAMDVLDKYAVPDKETAEEVEDDDSWAMLDDEMKM